VLSCCSSAVRTRCFDAFAKWNRDAGCRILTTVSTAIGVGLFVEMLVGEAQVVVSDVNCPWRAGDGRAWGHVKEQEKRMCRIDGAMLFGVEVDSKLCKGNQTG